MQNLIFWRAQNKKMSLISDGELRRQLKNFGVDVGPITGTTRNLYQKKLRSLRAQKQKNVATPPHSSSIIPGAAGATAGIKRKKHYKDDVEHEESEPKKSRIEAPHDPPNHHFSPRLYPDLSDVLLTPRTTENPLSSTPNKDMSFIAGGTGSPVTLSHTFRPSKPLLPDSPQLAFQRKAVPSEEESTSEEDVSVLVEPPSPQSLSLGSSFEPSSPEPREESGFFHTVKRFLGSRVSQLFNKPEPRRSLSSSFSRSPSRQRKNAPTPEARQIGASPSYLGAQRNTVTPPHRGARQNAVTPPRREARRQPSAESLASGYDQSVGEDVMDHSPPSAQDLSASSSALKYDWELEPSEVTISKRPDGSLWRLGKGGFGEVFKGLRDGVDEVAIKIIRLHSCSPKTIMEFKGEIDLISKLRHRNIVQFYGACIRPQNLYMVTELMDNDFFSVLRLPQEAERYKWNGIYGREVLIGVAVGLNYLHSRKPVVVHRDIKSPNILVMDGLAKITDVGVARTMAASDMTAQRGFTVAWAAPEVVYRRRATEKIDIWSYGIIIWEVVSGKLPRPGKLRLPETAPPSLKSLYTRCVSDDPAHRPTSLEIVNEFKNIHD